MAVNAFKFPHGVPVDKDVHWASAMDWCRDTFGPESFKNTWDITTGGPQYMQGYAYFWFVNEQDALVFKLKWYR